MRCYFEHHRGTNRSPSQRSPSHDNAVPPGTHACLHSTSLDTPGTNDGQSKGSNDMESFIGQIQIRLKEKDNRIAGLVADRDLLQTRVILHNKETEYHRICETWLSSRAHELEHAVMRFMAEQTPEQSAS